MADKKAMAKAVKAKATTKPADAPTRGRGKGPKAVVRPEGTRMVSVRMEPDMADDFEYIKGHMQTEGYEGTLASVVRLSLRQLRRRLESGENLTIAQKS